MSSGNLKEFKDVADHRITIDRFRAVKLNENILDKFERVKYDLPERIAASYLQLMPVVTQRLDAVEQHLERGGGRPFVRAGELPDVGAQVREIQESVELLQRQLAEIEQDLQ